MNENKRFLLLERWVAFLVLFLVFLISNRLSWLCVLEIDMPLFGCWYGSRTNEMLLYLMALVLVGMGFVLNGKLTKAFHEVWRTNQWLFVFLFVCILSLFWSVDPIRTAYKSILIIVATLTAGYLGIRYGYGQWLRIIVIFSFIVISLSYILVLFLPGAAIMHTPQHMGSWRGVFSHRNYLGATVAYGNVCILLALVLWKEIRWRVLSAIFYLLSWGLIVMSRSATGIILTIVLSGLFFLYLTYLKWGNKLRAWHYALVLGVTGIISIGLLLNSDWVFSLVGRSSTLTGRVPLWAYLIDKVSNQNLWLGFGLGTIWDNLGFRLEVSRTLGWSVEIINGHNGFVDVLVNLGLVGLVVFMALVIQIACRVFKFLRRERSIASIWALVTLVYIIVSNLTISYFFEFETFHWVLLIGLLFVVTPQKIRDPSRLVFNEESK